MRGERGRGGGQWLCLHVQQLFPFCSCVGASKCQTLLQRPGKTVILVMRCLIVIAEHADTTRINLKWHIISHCNTENILRVHRVR